MLDIMRRNSNSWLITLIFGVIIFVFAINFGPWVGNMGQGSQYAAEVNGQAISFAEFQMAYAQQIRMVQSTQPDFNPEGEVGNLIKKAVLDRLVSKSLLTQLAQSQNFSITDRELAEYIKTNIFGGEKGLNRKTYQQAIYSNYRMSETQFENQLRNDLLAEQMSNLINTIPGSEDQKNKFFGSYAAYLRKGAKVQSNLLD